MSDPLAGLSVALVGRCRALHVAGRCLADLGARVAAEHDPGDDADHLWLGAFEGLDASVTEVDLVLRDRLAPGVGVNARAVVAFSSTSSHADYAGERLDERQLAAAGGVAVAVGDPAREPLPMPNGSLDAMCGFHLAAAGVSALLNGTAECEVAGTDVVAWMVATNLHLYLPYGIPWFRDGRRASGSGSCYPWSLFEASDGPYCLIGRTDEDWQTLIKMMGDPEWAREPRFADPRVVGRLYPEEADRQVVPWVGKQTREELDELMLRHRFPGAPVLRSDEVLELPSLSHQWRSALHGTQSVRVPGRPFELASASGAGDGGGPPLGGIVVLDLSWVWSGPAVSVGLADLGATVIKVESPSRPDNSRLRGAPMRCPETPRTARLEVSPYFHALNRSKLSVSLDLKTAEGLEVLRRLADRADVIIENLSSGVMDRWGIAPEIVHETNPGCVFVSMRGYRDHVTTRGRRAYAPVMSSGAGLEGLVAYPGEEPVGAMSLAFSDALATSYALLLSLAGLHARHAHGAGAAIMLSQFDVSVLANGHNLTAWQLDAGPLPLQPLDDADEHIVRGEKLASSPWISRDLIGNVDAPWIGPVQVSRLPWRAEGQLPALRGPAPGLGADTRRILEASGAPPGRNELRQLGPERVPT